MPRSSPKKKAKKRGLTDRKRTRRRRIDARARQLFADERLLYNAGCAIRDLGVIGEKRNSSIVTLAAMTRGLPSPVSVLMKGPPSTGKSTVVKRSLELHPPEVRIERASLSEKALAHGKEPLAGKILYLNEYRGGKDSRLLMRLLQSEGAISHEYTTITGAHRKTRIASRTGSPVILSTTTELKVFEDDEARFLSIWADESTAQTRAILRAQIQPVRTSRVPDLPRWHAVFAALMPSKDDFSHPPKWLNYVAKKLPLQLPRVRRDWERFLSLLKAIALARKGPGSRTTVNIEFKDYCVAYRILEPAMAATLHGVHGQELETVRAVRELSHELREVTVRDVAEHLGWKNALTYKQVKAAVRHKLLKYAGGSRQQNRKPLIVADESRTGFLPKPAVVLRNNPDIGKSVRHVDPFTGVRKVIRRGPE